jgi:hypothetical protein
MQNPASEADLGTYHPSQDELEYQTLRAATDVGGTFTDLV